MLKQSPCTLTSAEFHHLNLKHPTSNKVLRELLPLVGTAEKAKSEFGQANTRVELRSGSFFSKSERTLIIFALVGDLVPEMIHSLYGSRLKCHFVLYLTRFCTPVRVIYRKMHGTTFDGRL